MLPTRAEILLADDDPEVRRLIADALRKTGSRIIEAESGNDMLAQLQERAYSKAGFDLIISDVRMPGFTGVELLEALRYIAKPTDDYTPHLDDTPIILITAFCDGEVRDRARRLGATLFSKPFDIDDLRTFAMTLVTPADERYCDKGGSD
jgi:CheY-like chemotaxis protein